METVTELELKNPPADIISTVQFSPGSKQFLAAASWDGTLRLYDVPKNTIERKFVQEAPILDMTFINANHMACGSLDGQVKLFDINTQVEQTVGSHSVAARCVEHAEKVGGLMTGSWDRTLRLWDLRQKTCVGCYDQDNGKVYSMSINDEKIVVATSNCMVLLWDLRNMSACLLSSESMLKTQTRCIRWFPNKKGYVMSSIGGRVAVKYLSPELQNQKYQFKCHRKGELVYPVNAIAFHKQHNTFATGGSDGYVNVWDAFKKKRLCQFHKYDTSISALNFSDDGICLAIACSYMDELQTGPENVPHPQIYVRYLNDEDVKCE